MLVEDSPEELPHGWTVQFNVLKTGRKIKYYVNSGTGQKYLSKDAFIRNIKEKSTQLDQSQPTKSSIGSSKNNQQHLIECTNEHPEWLPHGWIMELKTTASGKVYKCYVEPSTGCKFYSKPEVVRYLETLMQESCTFKKKETLKSVLPTSEVKFEKSTVTDLPPGWIKEIKITTNANGIRKDPYYIDPISGYIFRSKRDVDRYLETGEISRHAFLPKKRDTDEKTLPLSAAKRQKLKHLATGQQILTGKGISDMGSIASSEAECSRESKGKIVSTVTMLPAISMVDIPSQKSPRDDVMDNDAKYKGNSTTGWLVPTEAEVSERNQEKKVNLIPETNNKQGQNSPESGITSDGSYKRKTQNSLSKCSSKRKLNLSRRSSRRLAGIEPELVNNSVLVVKANPEADNEQEQNCPESTIIGDGSYGGKSENSLSKSNNKRRLYLPCRYSKRLAGIDPNLVADSVSIVQALPKTIKSPKSEAILAVGLISDVLADKTRGQIHAEPITSLPDHTSANANNQLLGEPSNKSQKCDTTSSVLPRAKVSKKNQCELVISTDNRPVLTPEADMKENNSLESGVVGRGQKKNQNNLSKSYNKKGFNLPCRSSKRLAGLEPEPVAKSVCYGAEALQNAKRPCKSEGIQAVGLTSDGLASGASQQLEAETRTDFPYHALIDVNNSLHGEPSSKNQVSIHDRAFSKDESRILETNKTNDEKCEPLLIPPFGEFWSDPCLEFAFKTLTGEIPVEIAADNGLVSTPVADVIDERNLLTKSTDKSSNGKTLINSGKNKNIKMLHLPHQSAEQRSELEREPTANSIPNQCGIKIIGRESSKREAVLDVGLPPNNLAVGASQQFKALSGAEHAHYCSANVHTMPQNEPSSSRIGCLNDCSTNEHSRKLEIEKNFNRPELQPVFSFGDYWSDPCFEFAFKTLTGAIPVEDNLPAQSYFQQQVETSQTQRDGYFQQQVDTSQTLRDGSSSLPDFGLPSFFQTDVTVHFNTPEKQLASQSQVPLNNPSFLPSGSVSLPGCSSIGSQQPQRMKENKGLRRKVNS